MTDDRPGSFERYWPLFVRAHQDPEVRRAHFVAMSAALGFLAVGVVARRAWLLLVGGALALVPPLLSRRLLGELAPGLPFHPAWSAVAHVRMWALTLLGLMEAEVVRVLSAEDDPRADGYEADLPRPNMVTDHTLH